MASYIDEFKDEKTIPKGGPTISISGLAGSGKTSVARAVSEKFKLRRITLGSLFREMASSRGEDLNDFLEKVTPEEDREADRKQMREAMRGKAVIDSRLSGWVAGSFADFKIFIKAPQDERARRISGRDSLSLSEAKEKVKERDSHDAARYEKLYGVDIHDLSIYDLVLNNEFFGREETSEIICSVLERILEGRRE